MAFGNPGKLYHPPINSFLFSLFSLSNLLDVPPSTLIAEILVVGVLHIIQLNWDMLVFFQITQGQLSPRFGPVYGLGPLFQKSMLSPGS
jgi:hypothetical protein